MTPVELIEVIKTVGGVLTVSPDGKHLRCTLPRSSETLVEQLRLVRHDVLRALGGNVVDGTAENAALAVKNSTSVGPAVADFFDRYLRKECVMSMRGASDPHLLYRAFLSWTDSPVDATEEAFVVYLASLGFPLNEEGMIPGWVQTVDLIAAQEYERARTSLPANDSRTSEKGGIFMPLIVSTTPKQYELPDEGEHLAVLADVIDLGEVDTQYGKRDRVRKIWLVDQRDKEGKLIAVAHSYTKSLHEKSSLRKAIKAILGRDPGNSMDLETLLGTNMRLVIEHREYDDRTFAAIAVMLRPRKGDPVLRVPGDFVRAKDRNDSKPPSGGGAPPNNRNNGHHTAPASQDSRQAERSARDNRNKGKKQNVHNAEITDADVRFPGDAA
jgi:hypothetical protein